MQLIPTFFKLIRWPNLVFIILTQTLFYFFIFPKSGEGVHFNIPLFSCLVLASVVIAAAGNIINDYFDEQIDTINKPEKLIIGKYIKRRWAIIMHLVLSAIGIGLSAYVGYKLQVLTIPIVNTLCVLLLWVYSTTLKKQLLTGNIVISLLTAWVVVVVYFFCGAGILFNKDVGFNQLWLYKMMIVYSGFAFISSLIREAVKDMEDIIGDAKYHCKTMPIVWGVPASKVYVGVWSVVCVAALLILAIYCWQAKMWLLTFYILSAIVVPFLQFLKKLQSAKNDNDFHKLSSMIKIIMLTGISSMLFFVFK